MYENLTRDGHEDLTAATSAINSDTERQAGSVFATAQQQITDLSVGDFAESGDFSVREYMKSPDGGSWCSITRPDSRGRSRPCSAIPD